MGENKAFLKVEGERMIDRTVRIFRSMFPEVILVTNDPLEYLEQDALIVTDILPGKGALGGIYTGLVYASSNLAFVAACDMPFLQKPFIDYLLEKASSRDVVVPRIRTGIEPLHAVYSKSCIDPIRRMLDSDDLKVSHLFRKCRTMEVVEETAGSFDPDLKMFFNINAPGDFKKIS